MTFSVRIVALAVVASIASAGFAGAQATVLDDFDRAIRWTTHPSDGTTMRVALDAGRRGRSLRIDYAFTGGGYAIVRRAIPVDLPENYVLSFWIRGDSPVQNLEVKLVDSTGDNVWWRNQRDFAFPRVWKKTSIRKRQVEFAWGPAGGGELRRAAAIEIAITARAGGRGTVWLDDFVLEARPPASSTPAAPIASASSSAVRLAPARAIDGDSTTYWESAATDSLRSLTLDFGTPRELGGLVIHWRAGAHASAYEVQLADDAEAWRAAYTVRDGDGGKDFIYLPETETRRLRIVPKLPAKTAIAIRELSVKPIEWSASKNSFFSAVAATAPRGDYPKYLSGVQSYWTVVGVNGDMREALFNEQGMLEVDKRSFSIEPFLYANGRLLTWADVSTTPSLDSGYLPIPSVTWRTGDLRLTTTTFASGVAGRSMLWARYRIETSATSPSDLTLYLAIRPFQVNPPAQFLNTPGGTAEVRSLLFDGKVVRIFGEPGEQPRSVIPLTAPNGFGATTFDAGGIVASLRRGRLPSERRAVDSLGAASGALAYNVRVEPGTPLDLWLAIPWYPGTAATVMPDSLNPAPGDSALARTRRDWIAALDRVHIELPPQGLRFVESLKANIAWMLITRDGPALQPGARSYERAWIRDGAMMAAALLRLGRVEEARQFADWYARFQYPNGKVPCCVDTRGADPVPENDSHGQLIYLAAEIYRYTGDTPFLTRMWPHVVRAVSYIDSLRQSRMTAEYTTGDKRAYYGLVPQSISHEGYSAKPMHSYWDDLFTLRGLRDAVDIAQATGHEAERVRFARIRDEFRRDLMASYRMAMSIHRIDYLPGAVELGDFDATSTTVGVSPGGELDSLPHPALERTFEKYYENFRARRDSTWDAYTPYELRVVGTMVRLGWKDRAHELLDFFFAHQRPAAWRAWAEVVYRDSTATRFIGDLPHTWVGSDYIRSALDVLAYDRDSDSSIVIGAGIPVSWATTEPGVIVRGLRTTQGTLNFTMRATSNVVQVRIDAARVPPGGFAIRSPYAGMPASATVNGVATAISPAGEVRVRDARADVVMVHAPGAR